MSKKYHKVTDDLESFAYTEDFQKIIVQSFRRFPMSFKHFRTLNGEFISCEHHELSIDSLVTLVRTQEAYTEIVIKAEQTTKHTECFCHSLIKDHKSQRHNKKLVYVLREISKIIYVFGIINQIEFFFS